MSTMNAYSPQQFSSLPAFGEAQRNLPLYEPKLEIFGRVLHSYGMADQVGLALLHKHFELSAHEMLVEQLNIEHTESIAVPRKRASASKVLPHLFRAIVNDNDGTCNWFPLEFSDVSEDDGSLETQYEAFAANTSLLASVARSLHSAGAVDGIGLSLIHGRESIICDPDEVLTESTHEARRTLIMRPGKRVNVGASSTPTHWTFDGNKILMACTCQGKDHVHRESN